MGVAAADDGLVFVCDGVYGYNLNRTAGLSVEALQLAGMIFWPGCPGYMRGVAPGAASGEWLITAGLGSVARYRPALGESDFLGHGFDQLMGITTSDSGAVLFVEMGTGRVHLAEGETIRPIAEGLDQPMGIAVQGRTAFVTEAGAGRIARLRQDSPVDTIAEGLGRPEGLCLSGGQL